MNIKNVNKVGIYLKIIKYIQFFEHIPSTKFVDIDLCRSLHRFDLNNDFSQVCW